MIRRAHDDDRAELPLLQPQRKHSAFVVGTGDRSGDALDRVDAEHLEITRESRRGVVIRKTTAYEFLIDRVRRVLEYCHAPCDAAVNEVRGFERSGAVGIGGNDDDVGW